MLQGNENVFMPTSNTIKRLNLRIFQYTNIEIFEYIYKYTNILRIEIFANTRIPKSRSTNLSKSHNPLSLSNELPLASEV